LSLKNHAYIADAFAIWQAECEHSRQLAAAAPSLDAGGERGGKTYTLRWVLVHMIGEYARHNGHADLLRERIDGKTGQLPYRPPVNRYPMGNGGCHHEGAVCTSMRSTHFTHQ
jgi:uncharacterized protein DUF664